MMFSEQLLAHHILIFSHNPNQPIHVFRMITYQFRQLLDLLLQLFQSPGHVLQWV